jgi:phage gpG-like protein
LIEIVLVTPVDEVNAAFRAVRDRCGDLRPFWGSIATVFSDREEYLFTSGGDGNWPPLTPKYAAWKAKNKPGPVLTFDGDLRESLTPRFGKGQGNNPTNAWTVYNEQASMLQIGTSYPYAVFHHEGIGRDKTIGTRPPIIIDVSTQLKMLEVLHEDFKVLADELQLNPS